MSPLQILPRHSVEIPKTDFHSKPIMRGTKSPADFLVNGFPSWTTASFKFAQLVIIGTMQICPPGRGLMESLHQGADQRQTLHLSFSPSIRSHDFPRREHCSGPGTLKRTRTNQQKHGFTFETAHLVFRDPHHRIREDPFSQEQRLQIMGVL